MATHSAITNAEIDQDSPITEALLRKYRDNPIADFEGNGTGVSFNAIADVSAGGFELDGMPIIIPNQTSYTLAEQWTVFKAGTYRVTLLVTSGTAGISVSARVYKNGSPYGTERTANNSVVFVSEDLSFSVNDTIQIYVKTSQVNSFAGYVTASIGIAQPWYINIHSPGAILSRIV